LDNNASSVLATIIINTTGSIDGYVFLTNRTSTVISGATVSDGTRSAITNTNGYYKIDGIPAGTYTVTASKDGYYTNSTASVSVSVGSTTRVNVSITGPENFNVTVPGSAYPGGDYKGWWVSGTFNYFRLSTKPFIGLTTNYTIDNLFASVAGNYTIIYRYNVTNGWTSFVPGEPANNLVAVNSTVDDYYVMPNATERLEYSRLYT